jgi:PKD repeat protein
MTPTPLPFASDEFMEFLNQHPEAGKYFALGPQVIVVLDGLAYETTPAEVSEIEAPAVPEGQPAAMTGQPQPDLASSPPASSPLLALTADVTAGAAPLEVNFTGRLVSAPGDPMDYACAASQFEFGDGQILAILSECGQGAQRRDTANYVYESPGTYQVIYTLGDAASAPLTIVVSDAADTAEVTATSTPAAVANLAATPAAAPATSASSGPASSNQAATPSVWSGLGLWGLILLPLVGVAVGWFIWGRGKG